MTIDPAFLLVGAEEPRRRPSDWQVFVKFVTANWRRILPFMVLAPGACGLMLLWLENSLLFPAPKYDPRDGWNAAAYGAEDVWFNSADGTKLHGWYFPRPEPRAYLLYCHGNGDCVAYHGEFGQLSRDLNIAIFHFDYRGYGRSEGTPHEAGVLADGVAALAEHIERALGVRPKRFAGRRGRNAASLSFEER